MFLAQYFLVYRREYFPQDSPEKLQYILLHKSLGVCLLLLALLMIVWRQVGKRPLMPNSISPVEITLAKVTHFFLYAAMLLQPITGILMSTFGGRSISMFGWFDLPRFFSKNEMWGGFFYNTHQISAYIIIGIVGLHSFAALYHHFIKKDNVLQRMI